MATTKYHNHARPGPLQAFIYRAVGNSEPLLESITRGHVVRGMVRARDDMSGQGMEALTKSAAARLSYRKNKKDRWVYTQKHSVEVGFLSFVIAKEAKRHNLSTGCQTDPVSCFIGGILHDIGKTFLPLSLTVKELGIGLGPLRLFEGARMNDIEREVLREEHLAAGTRFVRLFKGDERIRTVLDMVGLHHVMYDGQSTVVPSYPRLLKGKELPFHARVAKTADFLSAVLPRHYRRMSFVDSYPSAMAYGMAVAGKELDPQAMACFITGMYDVRFGKAQELVQKFMHPGGHDGISTYSGVRDFVRDRIRNDPEFIAMASALDRTKVGTYESEVAALSRSYGFPTLEELSPLSINAEVIGSA